MRSAISPPRRDHVAGQPGQLVVRPLAAYARQAKNYDLEIDLCRIRLRAERKAGELLKQMGEAGERDPGGRGRIESRPATQLRDLGVSRDQSSDWQQLAAIPEAEFEAALAARPENRRDFPTTAKRTRLYEAAFATVRITSE